MPENRDDEIRIAMAKAASQSGVIGCGCCSYYTATPDQQKFADKHGLSFSDLVLADEMIKAMKEVTNA